LNSGEGTEFLERYASRVGRLVINFQSLEIALRIFLQSQPGADPLGLPHGEDFYSRPVGSVVALCPLTNQDSLHDLIAKFNRVAHTQGKPKIDSTLTEIRDAVAHGRTTGTLTGLMRSIKYSAPIPPDKKTVRVTFNTVLDEEWFKAQIERVYAALMTINKSLPSGTSLPS
jgi:hypothetical protein